MLLCTTTGQSKTQTPSNLWCHVGRRPVTNKNTVLQLHVTRSRDHTYTTSGVGICTYQTWRSCGMLEKILLGGARIRSRRNRVPVTLWLSMGPTLRLNLVPFCICCHVMVAEAGDLITTFTTGEHLVIKISFPMTPSHAHWSCHVRHHSLLPTPRMTDTPPTPSAPPTPTHTHTQHIHTHMLSPNAVEGGFRTCFECGASMGLKRRLNPWFVAFPSFNLPCFSFFILTKTKKLQS